MSYTTKPPRKRMNFMISISLVDKLSTIPSGERSDFVNEALEESLVRYGRRKAFEEGTKLRESLNLKIGSDEELLKKIRYGRK